MFCVRKKKSTDFWNDELTWFEDFLMEHKEWLKEETPQYKEKTDSLYLKRNVFVCEKIHDH